MQIVMYFGWGREVYEKGPFWLVVFVFFVIYIYGSYLYFFVKKSTFFLNFSLRRHFRSDDAAQVLVWLFLCVVCFRVYCILVLCKFA